jgi:hypothetical protein
MARKVDSKPVGDLGQAAVTPPTAQVKASRAPTPLACPLNNAAEAQTLLALLDAAGRHLGSEAFAPCAEFAARIKASVREHAAITQAVGEILKGKANGQANGAAAGPPG